MYIRIIYTSIFFVLRHYAEGPSYYAVAIAHKINPGLLVSNWRHRHTCHSGVGKAAGWIIPINTILDTRQIIALNQQLVYSFGKSYCAKLKFFV